MSPLGQASLLKLQLVSKRDRIGWCNGFMRLDAAKRSGLGKESILTRFLRLLLRRRVFGIRLLAAREE